MEKISNKLLLLLLAISSITFVSCDDNKGEGEEPETPGNNETVTTPTDDLSNPKEYFETTAELFMDYFNAGDQDQILKVVNNFIDEYAEYEIDFDNGEDEEDYGYYTRALTNFAKSLKKSIQSGNYARATASEVWEFADFQGVYEPNSNYYSWEKTEDSDYCIYRWTNTDTGKECELKFKASSDTYTFDGDDYNTVTAPKTITVTLTEGGTQLLKSVVKSEYNESAHTIAADINVAVANIIVTTIINGNDQKVTADQTFTIGDKTIETSTATVTGNDLCNRTAIEKALEEADEYENYDKLSRIFNKGVGEADILGRVQVKAEVSSINRLIEAEDERYDYDYSSASAEEQAEKKYANIINQYIKASFYFARTSEKQGELSFEAYCEEDYGYTWWDTHAILIFASDDSKYDFESYFGNGRFDSTENIFSNLLDTYTNALGL